MLFNRASSQILVSNMGAAVLVFFIPPKTGLKPAVNEVEREGESERGRERGRERDEGNKIERRRDIHREISLSLPPPISPSLSLSIFWLPVRSRGQSPVAVATPAAVLCLRRSRLAWQLLCCMRTLTPACSQDLQPAQLNVLHNTHMHTHARTHAHTFHFTLAFQMNPICLISSGHKRLHRRTLRLPIKPVPDVACAHI